MYTQSKNKATKEGYVEPNHVDSMFKEIREIPITHRKTLKESYNRMLQNPLSCNGLSIFLRLFRDHPHYKDIFHQFKYVHDAHIMGSVELKKHGENYMNAMKNIMDSLEDDEKLKVELKAIAMSHKKHGVRRGHLENMVEAVLESLESEGGVSDEERKAWNEIFKCIADLIEKMQLKM